MNTLQKIELQIKQKGINKKILLEFLGYTPSTWGDWKKGRSKTYYDRIAEIARYFNVTTDYLLGNEIDPVQTPATDKQLKFALFGDAEIDDDVLDDVKKLAILQLQLRKSKEEK